MSMKRPIKLLRLASVGNNRRGGMSRTMHLTTDYLPAEGIEVRQVFHDSFRWPVSQVVVRFTQPWEAGLVAMREIKAWGGCDIVEAHEPLVLGCGMARAFCGQSWKLAAFSYGIDGRGTRAMFDYRRTHGIPIKTKSRVLAAIQGGQSAAGLWWCDHVVCSNQDDIEYLVGKGFQRDQLTRHFSGVDDCLLERGRAGCDHKSSGILFLGSWLDRKGILEIALAVTQVLRRHPEAFFTAAGCQLAEDLVRVGFPADVQARVRVIPHVDSEEELARIYAAHSIFVIPSYYEGQPLVMMEAAAFGLAIVTTPVCGMLDFIRHDENGWFTPVGEAEPLRSSIERLITDKKRAARLGAAVRVDVERHTWRDSARNLARAYRRLVGCD
jgi:glycosyltransferase involved in cell wall biosynthesis